VEVLVVNHKVPYQTEVQVVVDGDLVSMDLEILKQ
jgi:hypothetical protein